MPGEKSYHKSGRKFPTGVAESTGNSERFNPVGGKPSGMSVFMPKKFGNPGTTGSSKRHNPKNPK